ncbi:hypothetical protein M9458_018183, partial [Cirrhinus mrigala]
YPGYSNYWYPQSHTAGPYGSTYPPGTEVNGQASYNPQVLTTFQAYVTPSVSHIHSRLIPLHSAVPFSGNVSLSQWGVQSRTVLHEYATSLQSLLLHITARPALSKMQGVRLLPPTLYLTAKG